MHDNIMLIRYSEYEIKIQTRKIYSGSTKYWYDKYEKYFIYI